MDKDNNAYELIKSKSLSRDIDLIPNEGFASEEVVSG